MPTVFPAGRPIAGVTFSICVGESYRVDGAEHRRFGCAVTTRVPGVGTLCPFVSEHGAVATQSLINVSLGRKGIDYLADGLAVDDALPALLRADDGRASRQLHGVDAEGTYAHSGAECGDWFGHATGDHYTVAGNLLVGEEVLAEAAGAYEAGDRDESLSTRLVDALAAGHDAGGDRRADLPVQSAALLVRTTEDRDPRPYTHDLRVDASETPIDDLRETHSLARQGHERVLAKYDA